MSRGGVSWGSTALSYPARGSSCDSLLLCSLSHPRWSVLSGKVHGSLARAGKVRGQTPKVEKQEAGKKKPRGRAYKRWVYNR